LLYYHPFISKSLKVDWPFHKLPNQGNNPALPKAPGPHCGLVSSDIAGRRTPENNPRSRPSSPVRQWAVCWGGANRRLRGTGTLHLSTIVEIIRVSRIAKSLKESHEVYGGPIYHRSAQDSEKQFKSGITSPDHISAKYPGLKHIRCIKADSLDCSGLFGLKKTDHEGSRFDCPCPACNKQFTWKSDMRIYIDSCHLGKE
jgi:hypothetical protein